MEVAPSALRSPKMSLPLELILLHLPTSQKMEKDESGQTCPGEQ